MTDYKCAVEIREAIRELGDVLTGKDLYEWRRATCAECAWRGPAWQPQPDGKVLADCRRNSWGGEDATGLGVVLLDWPACPAFVRRTEGGA